MNEASAIRSTDAGGSETVDPRQWVDRHGDYLFQYALSKVRRPEAAEDLVQETLLAAWRGREHFSGQALERTWLTAILKRKVIDWLRQRVLERSRQSAAEEDMADCFFSSKGKWLKSPKRWKVQTPETDLERAEFWRTLHECVGKLPPRLQDVFVLRHLEEQPSPDVCRAMGITPANLWVMLHRARIGLWRCLNLNWFGEEQS